MLFADQEGQFLQYIVRGTETYINPVMPESKIKSICIVEAPIISASEEIQTTPSVRKIMACHLGQQRCAFYAFL
jgi:hypothetical protein